MEMENRELVVPNYGETVEETLSRGGLLLEAHKEGVIAASMLLAAITGVEDEAAKKLVVSLNLRPETD